MTRELTAILPDHFAENPAYAGATFHGNEFNNKCEHDFNAEHIHVDVIEEKRYNDFPSISLLDVKVSLDDKSSVRETIFIMKCSKFYPHTKYTLSRRAIWILGC